VFRRRAWRERGSLREEKGAELVEFIGFMPFLLFLGLVIWQFMVFGHVMLTTANAARQGARAAAAYTPVGAAVRSAAGTYEVRWSGGDCAAPGSPVRVTAKLKIPIINIPYAQIPEIWTESTATARCEPRWW